MLYILVDIPQKTLLENKFFFRIPLASPFILGAQMTLTVTQGGAVSNNANVLAIISVAPPLSQGKEDPWL